MNVRNARNARNARLVFASLAAALSPLGWACTSPPSPYPDVTSFCTAKAAAICQAYAVCAVDKNACQAYQATSCENDAVDATSHGTRAYDPSGAGGCIDAINQQFGGNPTRIAYAQLFGPGSIHDKCERVFAGSAKVNQTCQTDFDCSGGLVCSPVVPGSTSSVCAGTTQVNQGDFCENPGSQCQNSYCAVQEGGAAQCAPLATNGQSCSGAVPCVSGQRCLNDVCQQAAGAGQPCTTNGDCGPDVPFCDPYAGGICTIGLTFATQSVDCKGFLLGQLPSTPGADAGSDAPAD